MTQSPPLAAALGRNISVHKANKYFSSYISCLFMKREWRSGGGFPPPSSPGSALPLYEISCIRGILDNLVSFNEGLEVSLEQLVLELYRL